MYTGSENRGEAESGGSPLRAGSGRDTIAGPEVLLVPSSSDRFDDDITQTTGETLTCQINKRPTVRTTKGHGT